MKAIVTILLAMALVCAAVSFPYPLVSSKKSSGGGLSAFSDNFNRADSDSMGSNWTETEGDIDIASNKASCPTTFDFSQKNIVFTGTACATVNQYAKTTFNTTSGTCHFGVIFRYIGSSSAYYQLEFDEPNKRVKWTHWTQVGGTQTDISAYSSIGSWATDPVTFGCTITGTGNSTIVSIWLNPTANIPDSASSWDGGAATIVFTDDPSSPVNTGNNVGIGGFSSGDLTMDDFYGGDL